MRDHNFYRTDPTYKSWERMKNRCSPTNESTKTWYAEKGITVCEDWKNSFDTFLADMGECLPGMSLDRIDNSKGYFKENCRWATGEQQRRNTSRALITEEIAMYIHYRKDRYTGSMRTLARLLEKELQIPFETIREVLKGRTWRIFK